MIGAISRSTRWRVSMVRSSPEFVAGSNCTKSASCSSLRGYVPDCPLSTGSGHNDPPCREAMGRRQREALTEGLRSEEHTSELQSLMRISYAVFCLKKKTKYYNNNNTYYN